MPKRSKTEEQGPPTIDRIKRAVIVALFSDDELMERFVLKGGNALDIVHGASARASLDVDLSMEGSFSTTELQGARDRIQNALQKTFRGEGYEVFDMKMDEMPESVSPDLAHFWGGYDIQFKLIRDDDFKAHEGDLDQLRRRALKFGNRGKFSVDLSKFEYVIGKQAELLDGYRIYVYSPEMLVAEKLRAICQQTVEYGRIVGRSRPGAVRGRDYVDIYTLVEHFNLDMAVDERLKLILNMFRQKQVPVDLLAKLPEYREFHRMDFRRVVDTVKPGFELRDFDFYACFVEELARQVCSVLLSEPFQRPLGT